MINMQLREGRTDATDTGDSVEIVGCWETLQGEGPFAGVPAVFVRLAGCNLQCQLCDTEYTTGRVSIPIFSLLDRIKALREKGLVVLTGGEPFRQNIGKLVALLCLHDFKVQIETNGTIWRDSLPYDNQARHPKSRHPKSLSIICSPKAPIIHAKLIEYIDHLKYVMAADHVSPHDGLPTKVLGSPYTIARPWPNFKGRIYLQPEDHRDVEINKRNVEAVLASCFKYGYTFCPQIHKLFGLE